MKQYFLFITLLFSFFSEGKTSVNEELNSSPKNYIQYFQETSHFFQTLQKKMDIYINLGEQKNLSDNTQENIKNYLGTPSSEKRSLQKLKEMSDFMGLLNKIYSFYIPQLYKMALILSSSDAVSGHAFRTYCQQIRSLRALEDKKNSLPSHHSGLAQDIDKAYEAIENIKNFFSPNEHYLLTFLSIQKINKEKTDEYDVRLSLSKILCSQLNDCQNILSICNKIKIDKFNINKKYKTILENQLFEIKDATQKALSSKKGVSQDLREISQANLSTASHTFHIPVTLFQNRKEIERCYQIVFNALNLQFLGEEGEKTSLTLSEREKNYPLYLQMIQSSSEENKKTVLEKSNSKRVIQHKKKKNKQQDLSVQQKKSLEFEEKPVTTIASPHLLEENVKKLQLASLENSPSFVVEQNKPKEDILPEKPQETEIDQCKRLLQEIMQSTPNQEGENYFIFKKAHSLYKDLDKREHLLLEIQQATSQLLMRVAEMKKSSSLHPESVVSQTLLTGKYKEDYLFIMSTPVRYLKSTLRFSVICRFIERIGGSVDTSRSGSRIALKLNNVTTTLHLHDSIDGILDGGRIMSIRDFITKAGVILKSEE